MIYECDVCGKRGEWSESWWWYGYLLGDKDLNAILIMCSDTCKEKIKNPKKTFELKIGGKLRPNENIDWGRGLRLVR